MKRQLNPLGPGAGRKRSLSSSSSASVLRESPLKREYRPSPLNTEIMSSATAASADTQRTLDPTKPGKYTVQLGSSINGQASTKDGYSSVVFNHKPSQTGAKRKTTIKPSDRTDATFELFIDDEESSGETRRCKYGGRRKELPDSYILVFDHEKQVYELNTMPSSYEFNMISAPWEKDETILARQYKQIEMGEDAATAWEGPPISGPEEDGSGAESDGPKASNPFDYRHYLNGIPSTTGTESKQHSNFSSPMLAPKRAPVEPTSQSARGLGTPSRPQQPRPSAEPLKNNKARIQERKPRAVERKTKNQGRQTKNVQGLVESEDDEAGVLIIDDGPRPQAKKRHAAPPKGVKQMSLHARAEAEKAARESQQPSPREQDGGSGYEEDDEEDGRKGADDDDVEDLELSEPAMGRPEFARRQSTWEEGDTELLEALLDEGENNEEEAPPPTASGDGQNRAVESESESEEE